MNRDPRSVQSERLFAAARKESPSEETRQRILAALRVPPQPKNAWFLRIFESRQRLSLTLAAASLSALAVLVFQASRETPEIAAESLSRGSAQKLANAEEGSSPEATAHQTSGDGALNAAEIPLEGAPPPAPRNADQAPPPRVPPSLKQELLGMQRARAALDGGDAASALAQLERFGESPGWQQLSVEANLLRIEALAQLGRTDEARIQARRFVEQNPNNPLVDRAAKFTQAGSASHSPSSHDAGESIKSEGK